MPFTASPNLTFPVGTRTEDMYVPGQVLTTSMRIAPIPMIPAINVQGEPQAFYELSDGTGDSTFAHPVGG